MRRAFDRRELRMSEEQFIRTWCRVLCQHHAIATIAEIAELAGVAPSKLRHYVGGHGTLKKRRRRRVITVIYGLIESHGQPPSRVDGDFCRTVARGWYRQGVPE